MVADPDTSEPESQQAQRDGTDRAVMLHLPVDVRSVSLAILALLASLFALQWGVRFSFRFCSAS